MSKTREISEKEYREALENSNYISIMNSASIPYTKHISADEMYTCKLTALWEALRRYEKGHNKKFTSFLYQRVIWECKRFLSKSYKYKNRFKTNVFLELITDNSLKKMVLESVNNLSDDLKLIIEQKYFQGLTLKEIGSTNGYSHETARKNLKKAIYQLREINNVTRDNSKEQIDNE